MALRINAAAVYLTDDPSIPKLISDLNGVADHYRLIAGQKSGTASGTEGTEDTETTETSGTTDPATGGSGETGGGGNDNPDNEDGME